MERRGEEVHVSSEEATSAVKGHNVRYVLAISLGLLLAIYAIVWLVGAPSGPEPTNPASEAPRPMSAPS